MRLSPGPGPEAEVAARPWSRGEIAAFVVLVGVVTASAPLLAHSFYEPRPDAAIYLETARALAAGEGYHYLGTPHVIRPPGFSVLLAPLVAVRGYDFRALNLFVTAFGALGVALLFVFWRPRIGAGLALLVALAIWWNPGFRRLSSQVMADVPGVTLVFACLLVERWAARAPGPGRDVLLGVCIALAAYVRTLAVLLLPAVLLSRALALATDGRAFRWSEAARRLLPVALVTVVVLLPWSVRNQRAAPDDLVDQTRLHSYWTGMWREDPGDPGSPAVTPREIASRIPGRLRDVALVVGRRVEGVRGKGRVVPAAWRASDPVALVFGSALLGLGVATGLRRRAPADLFVLLATGAVLVYFGFQERLVLPVYVLLLPAAVEALRDAGARALRPALAPLVPGALLLLLVVVDFDPLRGRAEVAATHHRYERVAATLAPAVDSEARLGTAFGHQHYGIFLERPVYGFHFAVLRGEGPEASEEVIDRYGVDTVFLDLGARFHESYVGHFTHRYGPPLALGELRLWRVRPRTPLP